MKPVPHVLLVPIGAGVIFTWLFLVSWVAYFWGDGDGERAPCCTLFEVFAGPLLAGSALALRGRRFGLYLLRFGSILCMVHPMTLFALWDLETDREGHNLLGEVLFEPRGAGVGVGTQPTSTLP
jgi:hypothetical protein